MGARIQEQQLFLFVDRTSSHHFRANQIRSYLSGFAYVLMSAIRRIGLRGTELARAQCDTIRRKLFEIGGQIQVTVRRLWLRMARSCPYQGLLRLTWARLQLE